VLPLTGEPGRAGPAPQGYKALCSATRASLLRPAPVSAPARTHARPAAVTHARTALLAGRISPRRIHRHVLRNTRRRAGSVRSPDDLRPRRLADFGAGNDDACFTSRPRARGVFLDLRFLVSCGNIFYYDGFFGCECFDLREILTGLITIVMERRRLCLDY
jgi:hypothetical protein